MVWKRETDKIPSILNSGAGQPYGYHIQVSLMGQGYVLRASVKATIALPRYRVTIRRARCQPDSSHHDGIACWVSMAFGLSNYIYFTCDEGMV